MARLVTAAYRVLDGARFLGTVEASLEGSTWSAMPPDRSWRDYYGRRADAVAALVEYDADREPVLPLVGV